MKKCEECGKELRFLECYRHPTLGKNNYLCNPCFDKVSESVAKWRKFVLSNSINMTMPKNYSKLDWEKESQISPIYEIY